VVARVEAGDLRARARVRGVGDEYDDLANGLNAMLDRLERLMGGLRHAGDAIAHDLRSPLTRLRARLEAALIEVERGEVRSVRR
ncbi:HAMP domain-containing protein, partial [Acinetobacter baumannii]